MDQNPTNSPTPQPRRRCPTGSPRSWCSPTADASGQRRPGHFRPQRRGRYPQARPLSARASTRHTPRPGHDSWWLQPTDVGDAFIRTTSAGGAPGQRVPAVQPLLRFEDDSRRLLRRRRGGVRRQRGRRSLGDAGSLFAGPAGANGYTGTIATGFGNPHGGRSAFVGESNGWVASRADLRRTPGRPEHDVPLRHRQRLVVRRTYGWFLDDIGLHLCGGGHADPRTRHSRPPPPPAVSRRRGSRSRASWSRPW